MHEKIIDERIDLELEIVEAHKEFDLEESEAQWQFDYSLSAEIEAAQSQRLQKEQARDIAVANAKYNATETWANGVNTNWSDYQLSLVDNNRAYDIAVANWKYQIGIQLAAKEEALADAIDEANKVFRNFDDSQSYETKKLRIERDTTQGGTDSGTLRGYWEKLADDANAYEIGVYTSKLQLYTDLATAELNLLSGPPSTSKPMSI